MGWVPRAVRSGRRGALRPARRRPVPGRRLRLRAAPADESRLARQARPPAAGLRGDARAAATEAAAAAEALQPKRRLRQHSREAQRHPSARASGHQRPPRATAGEPQARRAEDREEEAGGTGPPPGGRGRHHPPAQRLRVHGRRRIAGFPGAHGAAQAAGVADVLQEHDAHHAAAAARAPGRDKEMMKALNQMLRDRLEGKTPKFEQFMQRFGHFFGPDPPKTLDELIQHLEKQMAQMESLMQSLSPEMRQQMEELLASTLNDPELQEQMAELAAQLELLSPRPSLGSRYAFYGSGSLPLQEALSLIERLQGIEDLGAAPREGYPGRQLTPEQSQQLQQLLGPDARQAADQMSELAAQLEKKGYVQKGRRGMELTPRGMRRIGQKALRDLSTRLNRDRFV